MPQYKNKLNWHCSKKSCSVNSASIDRSACKVTLVAPLENNLIQVNIGKQTCSGLIDSGATISCVSEHIYRRSFKNVKTRLMQIYLLVQCPKLFLNHFFTMS